MAENYQTAFGNPSTKDIIKALQEVYGNYIDISTDARMPNQIFMKTIFPLLLHSENYDNKIHIQCKNEKKWKVLQRIFEYVVPYCKENHLPLHFKLVNIPLILINGWEPFPMLPSDKVLIRGYTPGDLARANWRQFTPEELSTYPIGYVSDRSNTYTLNGEEYEFESVFTPNFVFYTESDAYTKILLTYLKVVFSDEYSKKNDSTYLDYYPRFNIKINNMIFVSYGDTRNKEREMICGEQNRHYRCRTHLSFPDEYQEIVDSCHTKTEEKTCKQLNEFPKRVSGHQLCEWKNSECRSKKIFSPALLGNGKKTTIRDLYRQLGQEYFLEQVENKKPLSSRELDIIMDRYFREYISTQSREQRQQRELSIFKEREDIQEMELKKARMAGIKKPLKKEDFPTSGYVPKNGNVAESFSF